MIGLSTALPTAVLAKDLRLRMRGWRWAGVVSLYVAILVIVALAFLLQKYNPTSGQTAGAGIRLFQTLALFQLLMLTFVIPASVAGAISGERQGGTWDLLMASRVQSGEIVWGKLLAGIAFNLVLVGASLPIFSLVFLFGGVTLSDLIPTFLVFVVTILLLSSTSLVVSALTARLTVSYMISMLVALALTIGISLLALDLQAPDSPGILTLGAIPFQSQATPATLTPLAQLDPLAALLSAVPGESGGALLGSLGTVSHAFGLPWQMPLWGAYSVLCLILSFVLALVATRLIRHPLRLRLANPAGRMRQIGRRAGHETADTQPDGGAA
jgi:ABC-2 type transport system permease protein